VSENRAWQFHQNEIQALLRAKTWATGICKGIDRLFRAIADNQPRQAAYPIDNLLDRGSVFWMLRMSLDEVGHLIDVVAVPLEVPGRCKLGSHGIWVPCMKNPKQEKCAHRAALSVCNRFSVYFSGQTLRLCPELGLGYKPLDAAHELCTRHWSEVQRDLRDVSRFRVQDLIEAIEREHRAANELCRQSALGQPDRPARAPKERERMDFDPEACRVKLDHTWYDVTENSYTLLKACWDAYPERACGSHIEGSIKPGRVKKSLPSELAAVLESSKGIGCKLNL